MHTKHQKLAGYLLLIVASILIADGLYIRVKAQVAQFLLQRAWHHTVIDKKPVKPWPWCDTYPVARLQVQRLGIDCIVLEGESGEVLAFGPGHLSNSAEPVAEGNCALIGHRDTSFAFLKNVEKGDILKLQNIDDEERSYQVVSTVVKDFEELILEETVTPWLTLITCYPFEGLTSRSNQRFVVFAREVNTNTQLLATHLK